MPDIKKASKDICSNCIHAQKIDCPIDFEPDGKSRKGCSIKKKTSECVCTDGRNKLKALKGLLGR